MCITTVSKKENITSFHITDTIAELGSYFKYVPYPIFLSPQFFKTLERNPPRGMRFVYLLVLEDDRPKYLFPCQIHHFHAVESLKNELTGMMENSIFTSIKQYLRKLIAEKIAFNTLVVGNLLLTGEYYVYTFPGFKNPSFDLLSEVVDKLIVHLDQQAVDISVVMMKDFTEYSVEYPLVSDKIPSFHKLKVQPNMRFYLNPDWASYNDYLQSLSSKYRIRANRARKKLMPIKSRLLSDEEIKKYRDRLYWLYLQVSEQAKFNLFHLHLDYFQSLTKEFPDSFRIRGYFLKDQLVAFASYFEEETKLDAHFLGYHKRLNVTHQLYLNILLDLVQAGIEFQAEEIIFSRTAMEIKSSVGAKGEESFVLVRHRKNLIHRILPKVFSYLSMDLNWTPRNPFK